MKLTTTTHVSVAEMDSLWPRLAELPLVVQSCQYDRLHAVLAHEFQRVTTHVRLVGAGADSCPALSGPWLHQADYFTSTV